MEPQDPDVELMPPEIKALAGSRLQEKTKLMGSSVHGAFCESEVPYKCRVSFPDINCAPCVEMAFLSP